LVVKKIYIDFFYTAIFQLSDISPMVALRCSNRKTPPFK